MWRFIKNIFKKKDTLIYRHKQKTVFDFLMHYRNSEKELDDMNSYIEENWFINHICEELKHPSKQIMRRYNLKPSNMRQFAWYLLEQYFKGNVTIKDDAQSK